MYNLYQRGKFILLNYIWLFFITSAVVIGAINGKIDLVTQAAFDSAKAAVDISISLIGIMSLWLGIMKLAEEGGLVIFISKLIKPVTKKIFPDIPSDHSVLGNIAMNFSANALGLSNAATPLGIKAMKELQKLNNGSSIASNAMCTFLAINTAGFQLVPAAIIAILAAAGAKNPTVIIIPTLLSTSVALVSAVIIVKILEKLPFYKLSVNSLQEQDLSDSKYKEAVND